MHCIFQTEPNDRNDDEPEVESDEGGNQIIDSEVSSGLIFLYSYLIHISH